MLTNKKALVTGASRGIGRAIMEIFLENGAEVWALSTKEPADLAELQTKSAGKLFWHCADLAKTAEIDEMVENLVKTAQGFDILVNNAGITRDNLSFRMSEEDFRAVLDVNLVAAFILQRVVSRDMARRRTGSVINMASVVGIHGNGGQANYAAAKAGLIGLSKSAALEVASRGVRVNAIAPGFIETDMTGAMKDEAREKTIAAIPLRRMGKPRDIAEMALFLASDAASYITGQVFSVDGGMFM